MTAQRDQVRVEASRWALSVGLCLLALMLAEVVKPADVIPPSGRRAVMLVCVVLAFAMASAARATAGLLASSFVLVLQWSAVVHFQYFGTYFRRRDFLVLGEEMQDVLQGLLGTADIWGASLVGLAVSIALLLVARRFAPKPSRIGLVSLLVLLLLPAALAFVLPPWRMEPDDRRPALVNALYAWGGFLADTAMPSSHASDSQWKPYRVTPVAAAAAAAAPSVLIVMGESLNPDHLQITGGARDTTPLLNELFARYRGRGAAGRILTSGVSTRVALPMFLNVVREPDHPAAHRRSPANLFRVARSQGLQTAFLSVQEMGGLSSVIGRESLDRWMDALGDPLPGGLPDDDLSGRVARSGVDWAKPFFAVLNTRSAHIPYKANFPPGFARFSSEPVPTKLQQTVNEYDDAVRWFDAKVAPVIEQILAASSGQVLVVLTSDHGEVVGNGGRFGHNMFLPDVFQVPLVWFLKEADPALARSMSRSCMINQYELGQRLLEVLGFRLENPNESQPEAGVYWVNGNQLDGANGVFKYHRAALPVDLRCTRRE